MCSKIERRSIAALMLLGVLGCSEPAPLLSPLPPATLWAVLDAGFVALPAVVEPRVQTLDGVVFEFGGSAEVRRAGTGEWVALAVGDAVRVTDEVRTSPDGHLELRFGAAGRIQVHEGSELTLQFLEANAIRAEVRGLASGDASDGGELTLAGKGTGVVAVSRGGQLSLDANGSRAWASSLTGGAQLSSGGSTVEVQPGELAMAQGPTLTRPTKIPKRVLLSVSWPARAETNQPQLVLKGRTSAFARVLVSGRRVEPAADGSFEATVALKRGSQSVWVQAIDPLGRRAKEKRQISFDPSAPPVKGKVEYR